ncbi:MAG: hypothetical protein PHH60_00995, partial [Candidatus Margulisbacteria bacterium]|nr:hypothetical protein [Candidatus Margulisiibacteriota bacterium]
MKNRLAIGILMVGLVLGITGPSLGLAVPEEINIQGRVTGVTATTCKLLFEIYRGGDGNTRTGTLVWSKTYDPVFVDTAGVFNQIIGGKSDDGTKNFPPFTAWNVPFYLFISVNDAPLEPGQKLVAVPYAITAKNAIGGIVVASSEVLSAVTGFSNTAYGVLGITRRSADALAAGVGG